jgi:hypothetical protein
MRELGRKNLERKWDKVEKNLRGKVNRKKKDRILRKNIFLLGMTKAPLLITNLEMFYIIRYLYKQEFRFPFNLQIGGGYNE